MCFNKFVQPGDILSTDLNVRYVIYFFVLSVYSYIVLQRLHKQDVIKSDPDKTIIRFLQKNNRGAQAFRFL